MPVPVPSLSVRDITKEFGLRRVLHGLSFDLRAGQSLAVRGANGSGKSTLLKIVAGLQAPTDGEVSLSIDGHEVSPSERPLRVGFIAPYLNVYDDFSTRENLQFIADVRRMKLEASSIDHLIEAVGLAGRGDDHVKTFSSGMKQRVRFATALLTQPSLLILDEPGSNLDEKGRQLVADIVQSHTRNGGALLLATNIESEAELCDGAVEL